MGAPATATTVIERLYPAAPHMRSAAVEDAFGAVLDADSKARSS